jgi:SAM-dependent methyltransferase
MNKLLRRLLRGGRRAREIIGSRRRGGVPCGTCGFSGLPLHRHVLWPALIQAWELSPDWARWMDEREGSRCAWCGSSLRSGQLAAAIVMAANAACSSSAAHLSALFRDARARRLTIAEINSAGNLHRHLARCPGLRYSEFGSDSPQVPSEDLMALSYADGRFDLVITSDVLEHVPDIDRALRETHRVLRPGGAHVFSVPIVWDRATRQRATLEAGVLTHLMPASHHGQPGADKSDFLVFYEFGADFVDRCVEAGFEVELLRDPHNPAVVTFIARKPA